MHTQHVHVQPGLHRFSNEVRLHWFPSPPFGSPFHSFPFTHLFLLFLFMSSLASCPFISLLSFFCAHNGLGLSLYAHIYLHTQVLGRPGLDNEVGFIGCPCALGFSSQPHTLLSPSRPPSHVFTLLSLWRAHLHFRPSLNFCLPLGRRVCVCAPCSHRDSFELFFISRGAMNTLEGVAQRRPFHRVVIFLRDASGTYLQQFLKFAAVTHGTPSLRPDRRSRPCALGLLSF